MAARVADPRISKEQKTFSKLVRTTKPITTYVSKYKLYPTARTFKSGCKASQVHGITNMDLENEEPFSDVFKKFFNWMMTTKKKFSTARGINCYPGI